MPERTSKDSESSPLVLALVLVSTLYALMSLKSLGGSPTAAVIRHREAQSPESNAESIPTKHLTAAGIPHWQGSFKADDTKNLRDDVSQANTSLLAAHSVIPFLKGERRIASLQLFWTLLITRWRHGPRESRHVFTISVEITSSPRAIL